MIRPISIVTVTLNSARYLGQTIQSVADQSAHPYEFILVDGGSNDRTMEIVRAYENQFSHVVSEPDNGIADAMNKGVQRVTGDFVLFLHSDDYLASPDSLCLAAELLDDEHDIFAFDIIFDQGGIQQRRRPSAFSSRINFKTTFFHQAVICRKSLFDRLGGFDTQFTITMDYDFFYRAYLEEISVKKCAKVLSVMRDTGISSRRDWDSLRFRFNEERMVHQKHCRSRKMKAVYWIYWLLYPNYRRLRYLAGW